MLFERKEGVEGVEGVEGIMEDWNDACPVKCDVGAISTGEEKELSNCVAVRRCCSVPKDAVLTGF